MTLEEEKKIIKRVVGGDRDAFEELVLANQKNVYNLALKITRNAEDALDVSQEAFIKAYRSLAGFRFDARFSVWLYKLTYNLSIDALRKNAAAAALPLDYEDAEGKPVFAGMPDMRNLPEDSALRSETRKSIAEGINKLPPDHREVLIMREITGMNYDDIAATIGISSGTVKSRLSRARQKLAGILAKSGTYPDGYRLKYSEEATSDERA